MRTPFQPYGGVSPIIDKMIGNAYDVVKYVARYLKEIRYVAENMETIYDAVHGSSETFEFEGNGDEQFTAELPGGMVASDIQSISVIALLNGELHHAGGNFMYVVVDNMIHVDTWSSSLRNATYRVNVTYLSGE